MPGLRTRAKRAAHSERFLKDLGRWQRKWRWRWWPTKTSLPRWWCDGHIKKDAANIMSPAWRAKN